MAVEGPTRVRGGATPRQRRGRRNFRKRDRCVQVHGAWESQAPVLETVAPVCLPSLNRRSRGTV